MKKNKFITIILISLLVIEACSKDDGMVNAAPLIEDQQFTVSEDALVGLVIGRVEASDPEGDVLVYRITELASNPTFEIDSLSGKIILLKVLNFSERNSYSLTTIVTDGLSDAEASIIINVTPLQRTINRPGFPGNSFFDGRLAGADYWSDEPKMLSATLGFCDIVGVIANEITEQVAQEAGAAWRSDVSCENNGRTMLSLQSQIERVYIMQSPYGELKDGAIGLDGLPIVFSWPVNTSTVDLTDFKITLNTGEVTYPMAVGAFPNVELNERNTIVIYGEFANKRASTDPEVRYPAKIEIIEDDNPLILVGPENQTFNAVGLSWENNSSPYDLNNGPRLVGAKLNHITGNEALGEGSGNPILDQQRSPNDEFALYGGGDFRLRILTSGGFSPDGVGGVLPTDFEKFFRIHVAGENGTTVVIEDENTEYQVAGGMLKVIGLSDLGAVAENGVVYDDCYQEDGDNYIDVILIGDEAAARNITFVEIPSLEGGYSAFYNPGGPGTTPFPDEPYTQPGPPDMEPVVIALDNPMRVSN